MGWRVVSFGFGSVWRKALDDVECVVLETIGTPAAREDIYSRLIRYVTMKVPILESPNRCIFCSRDPAVAFTAVQWMTEVRHDLQPPT